MKNLVRSGQPVLFTFLSYREPRMGHTHGHGRSKQKGAAILTDARETAFSQLWNRTEDGRLMRRDEQLMQEEAESVRGVSV